MKIVEQGWEFVRVPNAMDMLQVLEEAGRTCWKSEDKNPNQDPQITQQFIKNIMSKNHESVIEHQSITVRVITDRGISHEIVRHRIGASYSQESTRYANYSKDKFGNEISVILPVEFYNIESSNNEQLRNQYQLWLETMVICEVKYLNMISNGATPQLARSVLPNSLKTEIVITMNLRAWRHFFELRSSPAAHPQIMALAKDMLNGFKNAIPVIFDNL